MGTPLASIGSVAVDVAALGAVVFVAVRVFGDQAFGLPMMIAVFTLIAGLSIAGNIGAGGLLVALGLMVVFMLAIGFAMSIARREDPPGGEREDR